MSKRQIPKPTEAELAILRVLWELGPATVRQVHEAMPNSKAIGYTTVLKLLQIMNEKGLVVRDQQQRSHVYQSAAGEEQTQRQLVGDLLDRAFGGSAQKLVMRALSARKASPKELREIREFLDKMEGRP